MTGLRLAAVLLLVFGTSLALAQGDPRRSGYQEMGPALQKMQDDDTANPAMLFVQAGAAAWNEKAGAAGKSCAECHGDAATSMKGVAARYLKFGSSVARDASRTHAGPFTRLGQRAVNFALISVISSKSGGAGYCPGLPRACKSCLTGCC